SSRSCVTPVILPKPLPTCSAAGTRSRKTFPACGKIAVTPVRTESPSTTVVCPTRTPATSVIAFNAPGGKTPGFTPRSRARARCAANGTAVRVMARSARWSDRFACMRDMVSTTDPTISGDDRQQLPRVAGRRLSSGVPLLPLFGHAALRERFRNAIDRQALPGSLLLHGARGVGKQQLALWTGRVLLCEQPAIAPCGTCKSCHLAASLQHPDL